MHREAPPQGVLGWNRVNDPCWHRVMGCSAIELCEVRQRFETVLRPLS
jgi:hypothetical protein